MIHYTLICSHGHRFDGWFASSTAFDQQRVAGHLTCPHCGSDEVDRALMAPNVKASARPEPAPEPATDPKPAQSGEVLPPATHERKRVVLNDRQMGELREAANALRAAIEAQATNVGRRFPEEARRIHYGEVEERAIYGEASLDDVRELVDEGIEILPVPGGATRSN